MNARLTDFGIGQIVSAEALAGVTNAGFTHTIVAESSSSQTGSQMYMAPELLAGKPASTRSDIYSLGVVLYQLLVEDLTRPLTTDWADHISDPLLRDDLKHCFAGNPNDRFSGAGHLAKNLRSLSQRQTDLARQQAVVASKEQAAYRRGVLRMAAVAGVVVIAITALALYASRQAGRASQSAREETRQRQMANLERDRAQQATQELRRNLYVADMVVAHHELEANNLGRAAELVRKYLPQPATNTPAAASPLDSSDPVFGNDLRGFEWRYLWKRCQGDEIHTFPLQAQAFSKVVFSPDGKTLAAANHYGTIELWDVARRTRARPSLKFEGIVNRQSLALSPDGKLMGVVVRVRQERGHVVLVDIESGRFIHILEDALLTGDTDPGSGYPVAFHPNGRMVAATVRGGVKAWSIADGKEIMFLPMETDVRAGFLAFTPDGQMLLAGTSGRVYRWNSSTKAPLSGFPLLSDQAVAMAIHPKLPVLVVGHRDGSVRLLNYVDGKPMVSLPAHPGLTFAVAFSLDGKTLATGGIDQVIRLWDVATVVDHAIKPDASSDTSPPKLLATLRGHGNQIWSLAFSPDTQTLASGSKDGTVKLWGAVPQPEVGELKGSAVALRFSQDGRVLWTAAFDGRLQTWDVATLKSTTTLEFPGSPGSVRSYALSSDGNKLSRAMTNGIIELWQVAPQKRIATFGEEEPFGFYTTAFSPDDNFVVTYGSREFKNPGAGFRVRLWDLASGREQEVPQGRSSPVFSSDGRTLATGAGNSVSLWDVATRQERLMDDQGVSLNSVVMASDGKMVAGMYSNNGTTLFEVSSGKALHVLKGHRAGVTGGAFTPDSKTIATFSNDLTVILFNVSTGQKILTLREFDVPVKSVLFSPDGNTLAIELMAEERSLHLVRVPSFAEIEAIEKAKVQ